MPQLTASRMVFSAASRASGIVGSKARSLRAVIDDGERLRPVCLGKRTCKFSDAEDSRVGEGIPTIPGRLGDASETNATVNDQRLAADEHVSSLPLAVVHPRERQVRVLQPLCPLPWQTALGLSVHIWQRRDQAKNRPCRSPAALHDRWRIGCRACFAHERYQIPPLSETIGRILRNPGNPLTQVIKGTQRALSACQILLRRTAIPRDCLRIVLRYAVTLRIEQAEFEFGLRVATSRAPREGRNTPGHFVR